MEKSSYLKSFENKKNPEYKILFSTKNTSLALLPVEEFYKLEQGEFLPEYEEGLAELGMLVDDKEKEKQDVRNMLSEINQKSIGPRIAIILNLACNFSCRYCYEGSLKGEHFMSDKNAEQLISFLKQQFKPGHKIFTLDFYGGEPLLSTKRIKQISKSLKPFLEERGVDYEFTLVTNGSLLTRKTAMELKEFGLTRAKITIDGPAENHNHFRPFKTGKGSYDTIINNIKECNDIIDITLSGIFNEDNYSLYPRHLDELQKHGLTGDKFNLVQFFPVMYTDNQYSPVEFRGGCTPLNTTWLVDASLMLRKEILKKGYYFPKLSQSPCSVDLDDTFTINYDGSIYKCTALIGQEEYIVGSICNTFAKNITN
jgi:uncharacterized protein